MTKKTLLERAFELAARGEAESLTELRLMLKGEGYADVAAHLEGKLIKAQLVKAMRGTRQGQAGCAEAQKPAPTPPHPVG